MLKFVRSYGVTIVLLVLIIIYLLLFGTAIVSGSSMHPTYENGDFLLVYKTEDVERGDIIAVNSEQLGKLLCKRVIGVAGDQVFFGTKGIYINGELIDEPYITESWYKQDLNVTVGEGEIFVLGDNRNNSTDSRELGCLQTSDILGISILNITQVTGLTRTNLMTFTIVCWVLYLALMFGKKLRLKKED